MNLPYLTDFPGIAGRIKDRPEDFVVQEIPLYEPSGQGEHVYCRIEKKGMNTIDTVTRLAAALNVSSRDIGYAGLKDARAVASQLFSILGTTPEAVLALQMPGITVKSADRHINKLRIGHLAGNRFIVKIREVEPADAEKVRPVLDELQRRGMPNYFGEQRFGRRGNNDLLGAALVSGDLKKMLGLLLGDPQPGVDDAQAQGARKAYDAGDLERALHLYPRHCGMERRVLARFIKKGNPAAAVWTIDERLRRLWVSALQSRLFNEVVAKRIGSLDRVMDGDLAWKHENGAVFHVESAAVEQPRADAFEISPTGPLVGYRMTLPAGEPLAMEEAIFAAHQITPADFRASGRHKVKGARRPLRIRPENVEVAGGTDEFGPHITLSFTLPSGAFATVLLGEVMRTGEDE